MTRFSRQSPISVMTRTLLEYVFSPDQLNAIFNKNRLAQRNRQWLFLSVIGLILLVLWFMNRNTD
jgi:predicted nucleic acid-binding Zn ribbon protein